MTNLEVEANSSNQGHKCFFLLGSMMSAGRSIVWEALGCLAGIEWTAVIFWCLITFSLCLVLVLLISLSLPVTLKEDESTHPSGSEVTQPPQGLDVFQQLFSQKLLPIDSSTGWQLIGVHNELRSWQKRVDVGRNSFLLYGSCAVIASHSQGILDMLKDITKFAEWDTEVTQCSYISLPATTDDSDHPLMADVVSLTLSPQRSFLDVFIDRLLAILSIPYNYLSKGSLDLVSKNAQRPAVVARSWKLEESMSSWMFSRTVFKGKGHTLDELWSYSLAQPATNDPNKCVMHHIFCCSSNDNLAQLQDRSSLRLAALKQYFDLQQLEVSPLNHTSLSHLTNFTHNATGVTMVNGDHGGQQAAYSRDSSRRVDGKFPPSNGAPDMYDLPLREEARSSRASTSSFHPDTRKSRFATASMNGTWQDNSSSDDNSFYNDRKDRGRRHRIRKTVSGEPGMYRGFGGIGAGDAGRGERSTKKTASLDRNMFLPGRGLVAEGGDRSGRKSASLDRNMVLTGSGDLEDGGVMDNLSEYETTGDQAADLVLRECLNAASINVNSPEEDQKQQTGGWSFHCLEKDVVILKRAKRGKYYSFLGKGIIKASPETVLKAIRNPRTRFTYDTMLKKMDIVKNLSDDLCLYHMVHEVPQFLKKESRDFCVMQVAKTQGTHHTVAFRSVVWPECPESESLSRGHILPSGWVIEPVAGREKQYSMVTYLSHFALCGKDVPQTFSDFLSVRVPLSVAYLRLFLEAHLP